MTISLKHYIHMGLLILFYIYCGPLNAKPINFPINKNYGVENYIVPHDSNSLKKYILHSDIFSYGLNLSTALLLIYSKDSTLLINYGLSTLSIIGLKELTKSSVSRYRPDLTKDNSFFSGHTSISFNAAMILSLKYGIRVGIVAIPVAMYVGYSRVMALKHYPSDVLFGAIMGILNALLWFKVKSFKLKIRLFILLSVLPYVFIFLYS